MSLVLTKKKFSIMVVEHAHKNKTSLLDAILYLCETSDLPVDSVIKYIDKPLAEKLEAECKLLNLI